MILCTQRKQARRVTVSTTGGQDPRVVLVLTNIAARDAGRVARKSRTSGAKTRERSHAVDSNRPRHSGLQRAGAGHASEVTSVDSRGRTSRPELTNGGSSN
jgi:hypothetical protein